MPSQNYMLGTLALHTVQKPDTTTGALAVPIYQTTSYVFQDTGHAANLLPLKELGNIYTRVMNPTNNVLEQASQTLSKLLKRCDICKDRSA